MAFTTLPPAGAKLPASTLFSAISELRPIRATKTAATARNTTIVRVADPELTISLPGNSVWDWYLLLNLSSAANAAGDFSGEMAFTAGILYYGSWGLVDTIASGRSADLVADGQNRTGTSPTPNFDIGCTTVVTACLLYGSIEISGTTPASLTLNWAQLASNVNNTTVNTGSTLTAHRVD